MSISFQPVPHHASSPALNPIAENQDENRSKLHVIVGIVAASVFATWLIVSTPVATILKTVVVAPIVIGLGIIATISYLLYQKLQS